MDVVDAEAEELELELDSRTCLVTGATSSVGRACVELLHEAGADLFLIDDDERALEALADRVGAYPITADPSNEGDIEGAMGTVITAGATLDAVIHADGILDDLPVEDHSADEWDEVLALNLRGAQIVGRVALRTMGVEEHGSIVLVNRRVGQVDGLQGAAGAAAAAAIVELTHSLARAGAAIGVRVNCLSLGFIETALTRDWPDDVREAALARTLLERPGTPLDAARAAFWLISDRSGFVTGAELRVDGGLL